MVGADAEARYISEVFVCFIAWLRTSEQKFFLGFCLDGNFSLRLDMIEYPGSANMIA